MERKRRSRLKQAKKLSRGKHRLRWERRRRIFLQRSNRGENSRSREGVERQRSRTETRFDRRNIIFNSRNR
jgi:hypothetical protein